MDAVREFLQGDIDFKGQQKAESINFVMTWVGAIVSLLAGFVLQNVYATLYTSVFFLFLTLVAVVPAWPFYNQNPVKWQGPAEMIDAVRVEPVHVHVVEEEKRGGCC